MQLRIICGDITTWPAQAIVNSASESLMSTGGPITGFIRQAAFHAGCLQQSRRLSGRKSRAYFWI